MSSSFIAYHHLGLGDHFICNGLINKLAETYIIHLCCKEHNFKTVSTLYKDNKNVIVFSIKNEPNDIIQYAKQNDLSVVKIGFSDFYNKTFDKSFYSQYGYDFSLRYNNFKLPLDFLTNNSLGGLNLYDTLSRNDDYCLISNVCSEGTFDLNIDTTLHKIYVVPGITDNLLDYVMLIHYAKEIHCIDSAFYHLVDSMGVNAKLFYYDVRNDHSNKIRVSDKWMQIQA